MKRYVHGISLTKWTYDDFKDRAKYKLGQTVYIIDIDSSNFLAPKSISIRSVIIESLSTSTLFAKDKDSVKIVYKSGKEYIFEDSSWATKEEAKIELLKKCDSIREFYLEKFEEYRIDLEKKYENWKLNADNFRD